jgi:predicted Zn-dependent protease
MFKILACLWCVWASLGLAAEPDLNALEDAWAAVKYAPAPQQDRRQRAEEVERRADAYAAAHSGPEGAVWQANALCLTAEIMHGPASLGKVRQARDLLLSALEKAPGNPDLLALLGSIYYEVPGWPIGFGDRKKAESYLRRAVAAAPEARDPNFFMGDFLLSRGQREAAAPFLERALAAAQQQSGPAADSRRREIEEALAKVRAP